VAEREHSRDYTDTQAAKEQAILEPDIGVVGILYPQAVSNYSFSSPYLNFNNKSADWIVAPSITSDFIGLPPEVKGVLSGPTYPSSCTTTPPNFTCILDVAVIYSGNVSKLPVLSDDPLSYSRIIGIDFSDPIAGELRLREGVVSSQVVTKQSIPESNLSSSVLAFGITASWLLIKRKSNKIGLVAKANTY
jgi:hypothetical protein